MSQFQKTFKRRRNKFKIQHGGGGGSSGGFFVKNPERPWIDFARLPADLSPEAITELEEALPKPRAKAKQIGRAHV